MCTPTEARRSLAWAFSAAIRLYTSYPVPGFSSAFCPQVSDLGVFDILTNFSFNMLPSVKASFPKLVAFAARVAARPKMAAYLESPKYTALFAFPNLEK